VLKVLSPDYRPKRLTGTCQIATARTVFQAFSAVLRRTPLLGTERAGEPDDPAWITGFYRGQLFQPLVFLYDSHGRREVVGQIPHGGRVRIVLTQANPALDYYFVRSLDLQPAQEGWIPAPFVALDGPPPSLP